MLEDALAVIVCLNIGDYDATYWSKSIGRFGLVYNHYKRMIKDTLHSKYLTTKSVALVLYKGDFEMKIQQAVKFGKGHDISFLFPEYKSTFDLSII
jgi:hypothetical protein